MVGDFYSLEGCLLRFYKHKTHSKECVFLN
jgi:hypothetical protein